MATGTDQLINRQHAVINHRYLHVTKRIEKPASKQLHARIDEEHQETETENDATRLVTPEGSADYMDGPHHVFIK